MTTEDKKKLYEVIMTDVAKIIKRRINEINSNNSNYDDCFIQFIKNLENVSLEEIRITKIDIINRIKKLKINEDATDDALNYILSGKSKLGSDVKFEQVLETFDDLFENPSKNFREIMIGWYAYCSGEIGDLYHFKEWQMLNGVTIDNVPFIDFLIPKDVANNLITDLRSLGLVERDEQESIADYIQYKYKELTYETESLREKFNGWIYLRFVPMSQENVRKLIRNNSQYIYHITDASYIDSIKENGIQLANRSHPEAKPRIFLLVPNRNDIINQKDSRRPGDESIFNFETCLYHSLPLRIYEYRLKDGIIKERNPYLWKFAIIKIDIDKIPNDVEFYWDVHSFPFAFFTVKSIPASSIVDYKLENIK